MAGANSHFVPVPKEILGILNWSSTSEALAELLDANASSDGELANCSWSPVVKSAGKMSVKTKPDKKKGTLDSFISRMPKKTEMSPSTSDSEQEKAMMNTWTSMGKKQSVSPHKTIENTSVLQFQSDHADDSFSELDTPNVSSKVHEPRKARKTLKNETAVSPIQSGRSPKTKKKEKSIHDMSDDEIQTQSPQNPLQEHPTEQTVETPMVKAKKRLTMKDFVTSTPTDETLPIKEGQTYSNKDFPLSLNRENIKPVEDFIEFCGEGELFIEDIGEDDEIYIVQCPNTVQSESLVGCNVNLNGESVLKLNSDTIYESYSQKDSLGRVFNMLLPSRLTNSMKLGVFPLAGSIVLSEGLDVPSIEEFQLTKPSKVPLPDVVLSKDLGSKLTEEEQTISVEWEQAIPTDQEVFAEVKKKKKKKHKDQEHIPIPLEDAVPEEQEAIYDVKKKKKKKKKMHKDEEQAFPVEMEGAVQSGLEVFAEVHKKKKNKHKENEAAFIFENEEFPQFLQKKRKMTEEEYVTEDVQHIKKKKRHQDTFFVPDDIACITKKKKKKKSRDIESGSSQTENNELLSQGICMVTTSPEHVKKKKKKSKSHYE